MQKNNFPAPAFSLIEVLVAVTLISFILTAISVNMVYTQRSVKNAQLRAKAIDQANSCLNEFRNARDSMLWVDFCKRLKHCSGAGGTLGVDKDEVQCIGYEYSDYVTCDPTDVAVCTDSCDALGNPSNCPTNCMEKCVDGRWLSNEGTATKPEDITICPEIDFTTIMGDKSAHGGHYTGQYEVIFNGTDDNDAVISGDNARSCYRVGTSPAIAGYAERAEITIIVHYDDFNGKPQKVKVMQAFAKADNEANYCGGTTSCPN
jgi:type II secretory pathway pseudopilin PulG